MQQKKLNGDNGSKIRKPTPKKYYLSNPKSLIEKIIEIVGEPDYNDLNQFSDKQIIKFLDSKQNLSDCILYKGESEKQILEGLLQGILTLTKSRKQHHIEVLRQFNGKFTDMELECVFNAYNSLSDITNDNKQTFLKNTLYGFLNTPENVFLDYENVEKLKLKIDAINPIVFDIFIDSILTLSTIKKQSDMIRDFKKN